MLHVLIVDDEPNIVEGLCLLIQSMDDELDVAKAYSGKEALAMAVESPVDLVLSDIRMPGMSGLQLLEAIEKYWPACRVVFLTGYDEFEYIHTAVKSPQCAGYLLKTEGDEAIVETMRREVEHIRRQREHNTLLDRAREQMTTMESLLRQQYLHELAVSGSVADPSGLRLRIDPSKPMLAVCCRASLPANRGYLDRVEAGLAIDEAIGDAAGGRLARDFTLIDGGQYLWLLQPLDGPEAGAEWLRFLSAALQQVQNSVRGAGLSVSFVVAAEPVPADMLPMKTGALQALAGSLGADDASEMVIQEGQAAALLPAARQRMPVFIRQLEPLLLRGSAADFAREFSLRFSRPDGAYQRLDAAAQSELLSLLLSTAGRLDLSQEVAARLNLQELLPVNREDGVSAEVYLKFGQALCRLREARSQVAAKSSIEQVKQYVGDNVGDKNLSLSRIAAHLFYNPSYLSRFFKQETGVNLSDYINDIRLQRAVELLGHRDMRIGDIVGLIGLESPSYFTMFFKKRMGMTPNDYRASL